MSYLLFLDESGHDHRTMPYEVRGGVSGRPGSFQLRFSFRLTWPTRSKPQTWQSIV